MNAVTTTKEETTKKVHGRRRITGIVVSDKMKDTIVVSVTSYKKDPKYGKFLKTTKRYKAHDAGNTKKMDETVVIEECRPLSKDKHFKVV